MRECCPRKNDGKANNEHRKTDKQEHSVKRVAHQKTDAA